MVFYRERENERPPLSLILPRLYLGAESDVTQDSLGARGISYVLSVSRCSPQPTFLPRSQYLRIPIDDSLRDDLLPWIPEALHFIDGAMSSGGSVLVHCAAGISRSPALAVAYIMYSLGMDLDHAYRFVKERRPSISPNFNFLGQLQHFQGTLSQKASDGSPVTQPLQSFKDHLHSTVPLAVNHQMDFQGNGVAGESAQVEPTHAGNSNNTDKANSKYSRSGESGKASNSPGNAEQVQRKNPSALTLSLSGKLRTLHLTLNENQREARMCCEPPNPSQREPAEPVPKPNQLQLPVGHSSLLEKRKSLTLSLSPVGAIPTHNPHPASPKTETGEGSGDHQTACSSSSKTVHKREMGAERQARRRGGEPAEGALPGLRLEENQREWSSQRAKYARATHDPPRARVEGQREGRAPGVKAAAGKKSEAQMLQKAGREASRGRAAGWRRAVVDQQPSAEAKTVTSSFSFSSRQPEETSMTEEQQQQQQQGPLSPLNLTLNKLLGWGEKMLLGVLLGPRIKMGQAALPYRC